MRNIAGNCRIEPQTHPRGESYSVQQLINGKEIAISSEARVAASTDRPHRIAHAVNPVDTPVHSELHSAQPFTFESMRRARQMAEQAIKVELVSVEFEEDSHVAPREFRRTTPLQDSVLDYGNFQETRKLPLLRHILERLYQESDAEYLIYTNVDIGVMPQFYLAIDRLIARGFDAMVINRRTLPAQFSDISDLPLIYSVVGDPHPGYDCFVFRRDLYPKFELGDVCIGMNWVGVALLANLAAMAERMGIFAEEHLTFHLGNDKIWQSGSYDDYRRFNSDEARGVFTALESRYGRFDRSEPPGRYFSQLGM